MDLELHRLIVGEIKNNREEAKLKYKKTKDRQEVELQINCSRDITEENPQIKIKGGNPPIKSTRQMRTQLNITQRKNKSKQSTNNLQRLYAKRTHDNEMTINNNKKNLRQKNYHLIYHKSINDKGALAMVCERDEEFESSIAIR